MTRPSFKIEFRGGFFERDPRKTFRQNVMDMMDGVAREGEDTVRKAIQARAGSMPRSKGWTAAHVKGRTRSLSGRKWQVTAVISANTAGMSRRDAMRTKAAAASVERRFHPFRRAAAAMRRSRAVMSANLTKGIE